MLPSSSAIVPMDKGDGTAATNLAKASVGSAQASSSIDAPAPGSTRSRPGRGGRAFEREQPIVGGRRRRSQEAPAASDQLVVERHAGQVRPDHGDRDLAGPRGRRRSGTGRLGHAERAQRKAGAGVHGKPDAGELRVAAAGRQQRNAERRAVGAQRDGNGDAGKVEQVDEVGVGAEPRVGTERVGLDLGHGGGGRHGRHHQRVDATQRLARQRAQLGQAVDGRGTRRPRICPHRAK